MESSVRIHTSRRTIVIGFTQPRDCSMGESGMGWISRMLVASVLAGLAVAGVPGVVSAKPDQPVFCVGALLV